jgi:cardiolipin synthase
VETTSQRRVATVPNAITAARIAAVAVFAWLLLGPHEDVAAMLVLGAIGASDWVDGYLARRLGQVSDLGKALDPVADWIAIVVAVGGAASRGFLPVWLVVAAAVRELFMVCLVGGLAVRGVRLDVRYVGKVATFGLYIAFPLFIWAEADLVAADAARVTATVIAIVALALYYVAAVLYARDAAKEVRTRGTR